jgi:hypothetical protein
VDSLYIAEPSTREPKPIRIKLLETPPDERREFIQAVLDGLIQSRFRNAVLCEIVEFEQSQDLLPEVFFDITAFCRIHPQALLDHPSITTDLAEFFASEVLYRELSIRASNVFTITPPNHSPPNVGTQLLPEPPAVAGGRSRG